MVTDRVVVVVVGGFVVSRMPVPFQTIWRGFSVRHEGEDVILDLFRCLVPFGSDVLIVCYHRPSQVRIH